jgi:lysophospholipase
MPRTERPETGPEYRAFQEKYESRVRPFFEAGKSASFIGGRGVALRYVCFPVEKSPGALVILPGKGEPYLKYAELFYDIGPLGLTVYALDHRGLGSSDRLLPDRRKVHVDRFDDYLTDVELFLEKVVRPQKHRKVALLAHSMGGLIAARLLQDHPGRVAGAILCSPAFELNIGPLPFWLVRFLARRMEGRGGATDYGPGQEHLSRPSFERNLISHSFARWELWEERIPVEHPQLVVGGVTRRWLHEIVEAGRLAVDRAASVREPVLVLKAGKDRIVRHRAVDVFCRRCPSCTSVLFPEARHEILIETDRIRDIALGRIMGFLRSLMEGTPPPRPG